MLKVISADSNNFVIHLKVLSSTIIMNDWNMIFSGSWTRLVSKAKMGKQKKAHGDCVLQIKLSK